MAEGFDNREDTPATTNEHAEAKHEQHQTTDEGNSPDAQKKYTHVEYDENNPLDVLHSTLDQYFSNHEEVDNIYLQVLSLATDGYQEVTPDERREMPDRYPVGTYSAKDKVPEAIVEERAILMTRIMANCSILGLTDENDQIDTHRMATRYIQDMGRLKLASLKAGGDKRGIDALKKREQESKFYAPLRAPKEDGSRLLGLTQFLWMKDHPEFKAVCEEIGSNKYVLDLFGGKTKINIGFNRESLQILRGLSFLKNEFPTKPIDDIIKTYGNRITHFFSQCEKRGQKQFDHMIYVNVLGDAEDPLLPKYQSLLKPGSDLHDYRNTTIAKTKLDKFQVVSYLERYTELGGSTLLVMRGHGGIDKKGENQGTGGIEGATNAETVDQQRFENIANNPKLNKNLVMDVDSCFSGAKFDGKANTIPVLSLSAYNDTARYTYDDTITDGFSSNADYDGDGITSYADVRLYTMLNYQDSFLPTKFIDGNGKEISLS